MKYYLILYTSTFLLMAALDLVWIGGVASNFYKARIGELMAIRVGPAVLFYVMYVVGVLIFVSKSTDTSQLTLLYGALFGFFCYATYDLTNLATLKGWSLSLVIVDIAWGSFVTAVAATGGKLITNFFLPLPA